MMRSRSENGVSPLGPAGQPAGFVGQPQGSFETELAIHSRLSDVPQVKMGLALLFAEPAETVCGNAFENRVSGISRSRIVDRPVPTDTETHRKFE